MQSSDYVVHLVLKRIIILAVFFLQTDFAMQFRPLLAENPDIVVGTPSRILGHIQAGNIDLKNSVEMVVIDEADLVFSYGYEQDLRALLTYVVYLFLYILV